MNVLYSVPGYPPPSFICNELHELDRRGHGVAVFAVTGPDDLVRKGGSDPVVHDEIWDLEVPVEVCGLPGPRDAPKLLLELLTGGDLAGFERPKPALKRKYRELRFEEFVRELPFEVNLVHVHVPVTSLRPGVTAANDLGIPCTATIHAREMFVDGNVPGTLATLSGVDRIVVPSEYNRRYLREELGVSKPIDYVPASIRLGKFAPTEGAVPKRLLTVGRLVEKKGYPDAFEAVETLVERHPDVEYHVVGDGPLRDELEGEVARRGLDGTVSMLGHVDDGRLIREYDEARVFVLPCVVAGDGNRDAMPVVLKEAMAMRTPCVSTRVSGIPELVADGENGILVDQGDADALARAVDRLLTDGSLHERLSNAGRETVEGRYHVETEADRLLESFERTVEGAG